jgi:hypothetical protein
MKRYAPLFLIGLTILIVLLIIYNVDNGLDFNEDWTDIAVEFHGLVFDAIFAITLYLLYQRRENEATETRKKQLRIERWEEELEDYRGWIADESAVRILGILRRLKKAGVKDVDINDCSFKGRTIRDTIFPELSSGNASFEDTILDGVDIKNSNLDGAYFKKANLNSCSFENSEFGSSFYLAELYNVDFSDAKWRKSFFDSSTLNEVKFNRSDLKNVKFTNASLVNVDFSDAKNVTVEQLLVATRLLNPKGLSSDFIAQIEKKEPALLTEEGVIRPMVW